MASSHNPPQPSLRLMLKVLHRGEAKFAGKIFPLGQRNCRLVFLHEYSGTQAHRNTASPGGVDAVVLDYLEKTGVAEVHFYNRTTQVLYVASVADIRNFAVRQQSAGRDRFYLPSGFWKNHEKRYDPGFIPTEVTLDPAHAKPDTSPDAP